LEDLKTWLAHEFPSFTDADVQKVLNTYPSSDNPVDPTAPKFATNGLTGPTVLDVSHVATGQQQRANNILGEALFVCLATGSTQPTLLNKPPISTNTAFVSQHTSTTCQPTLALRHPTNPPPCHSLSAQVWGNFIKIQHPAVPNDDVLKNWPRWDGSVDTKMANLNETGGVPYQAITRFGAVVTQFANPGLRNDFKFVDAYN
jgi:hypothetical protein